MIRAVFEGAIAIYPDMHSPTSRAIYGVDVMLDASCEPKLLEVMLCTHFGVNYKDGSWRRMNIKYSSCNVEV